MYEVFEWLVSWMSEVIGFWKQFSFTFPLASGGSVTVNYFALIIGFLVLGFVISVFWKGAKT